MYVILILSVSIVVSLGYYTLIALNRATYPDTIRPWRPTRFHAVEIWRFSGPLGSGLKGDFRTANFEKFPTSSTRY